MIIFRLVLLVLVWHCAHIHGFICRKGNQTSGSKSNCDIPQGLELCGDVTTYSVCLTEDSWIDQEDVVRQKLKRIVDSYGFAVNRSKKCLDTIRKFQCASVFAACEGIDARADLVCASECDRVRAACSYFDPGEENDIIKEIYTLDDQAYAMICDTGVRLGESQCFTLSYTGPSYYLWAIGLGLAITFSFLNAVALNIQKLSLNRHSEDTPVFRQPLWIAGFFLLLLGSIMDFIAFGLAPASLLAPLAALSLVWNMIAAPCFLGEKLNKFQIIATMIIFSGAVITVVFSNHTSPLYTLEDLKFLFLRFPMIIYTVAVPLIIIAHMVAVDVIEALPPVKQRHGAVRRLHLLGYAGAAGITGGQSILFAKSTVELFKSAFAGASGLGNSAETYFIISGMILCLLIQITYLNGGLLHHDSLSIVPVYQAYWIISGVIGGLIYFDEIRTFTMLQLGLFSLGILITIGGVAYLAHLAHAKHMKHPVKPRTYDSDEEEEEYEEERGEDVEELLPEEELTLEDRAFNNFLLTTPRAGAAEILLDMGVQPSKLARLTGNQSQRINQTRKQKELLLTEMGVRPDIAKKMLRNSGSTREVLQQQDTVSNGEASELEEYEDDEEDENTITLK